MKKHLFLLSTMLFLWACDNDNKTTPKPDPTLTPKPTPDRTNKDITTKVLEINLGGPQEPNQVYLNLETQQQTTIARNSWDLALSNDDKFSVRLNPSMSMAVKPLDGKNLNEKLSKAETDKLKIETNISARTNNTRNTIDHPDGSTTALGNAPEDESKSKVFFLNRGGERGLLKIKISQSKNAYKIQWAKPDSDQIEETTVNKESQGPFTYFSFDKKGVVKVAPERAWDLLFTVFTELATPTMPYTYKDFVALNIFEGARAYMVTNEDLTFDKITKSDVKENDLENKLNIVGSKWRSLGVDRSTVHTEKTFIVKTTEGKYYKIAFISIKNNSGERGYIKFRYAQL